MLSAMSDLGDRGLGLGRLSVRGGRGHYDPDQPRVPRGHPDGGQWTDEDGVPARSNPVPSPIVTPAPAAPSPAALPIGLGAGMVGLAASVFAAAMTTFSRSVGKVEEGELRHFPGLRYRYDDGFLTIHGPFKDGAAPLLFHGRADKDALFRLRDGTILGHERPTSIALNDVGIALVERRHQERIRARRKAGLSDDDPKLCPEETPERQTNYDLRWRLYQYQVTGTTPGFAYKLWSPDTEGWVEFDGCREDLGGLMEEAKGPGYIKFLLNGEFKPWAVLTARRELIERLKRQSVAAGPRGVEWTVADKPVADWIASYLEVQGKLRGIFNIEVRHEDYIEPDEATIEWLKLRLRMSKP